MLSTLISGEIPGTNVEHHWLYTEPKLGKYLFHKKREFRISYFIIISSILFLIFQAFIFCVTVLTTAVVLIAYWVGLPYWWQRCPYTATFLVIVGNWILLNIVFHYYMGIVTSPGHPPQVSLI